MTPPRRPKMSAHATTTHPHDDTPAYADPGGARLAVLEVKLDGVEAKLDSQASTLEKLAESLREIVKVEQTLLRFEYETRALGQRLDGVAERLTSQEKRSGELAAGISAIRDELPTLKLTRDGAGLIAKMAAAALVGALLAGVVVSPARLPSPPTAAALGK